MAYPPEDEAVLSAAIDGSHPIAAIVADLPADHQQPACRSDLPEGRTRARKLSADQRRALAMLDCNPRGGCTEPLLRAHGFRREVLAELVIAKLATAEDKRMVAGGKAVDVRWFGITDAGRRALSTRSPHPEAQ
jgi:hypothetical protein